MSSCFCFMSLPVSIAKNNCKFSFLPLDYRWNMVILIVSCLIVIYLNN